MSGVDRVWAMFAKRGMNPMCHEHPDGWHHYELVDGEYVDRGPCTHEIADTSAFGDCGPSRWERRGQDPQTGMVRSRRTRRRPRR